MRRPTALLLAAIAALTGCIHVDVDVKPVRVVADLYIHRADAATTGPTNGPTTSQASWDDLLATTRPASRAVVVPSPEGPPK